MSAAALATLSRRALGARLWGTVVAFAAVFTFSSLVIAPRLTGSEKAPAAPGTQQPDNHASHHGGTGSK
jgi:hypothetical protein